MSLNIDHAPDTEQLSEEIRNQLFSRLKPEDVEQFYMAYQLWSQQQQITRLQLQMHTLEQKIAENIQCMEQSQPSAIALATLVQLQAYGVENIDLLDRMLERGDEWLDHCLQLLQRCEQLDLIGGDYTQWCEHAMEGAYEWMDSIAGTSEAESQEIELTTARRDNMVAAEVEVTEAQLLRKLMDADDETDETDDTIQMPALQKTPRITKPLAITIEQASIDDDTIKNVAARPINHPRITQPLTIMDEQEEDDTKQIAIVKSPPRITKPLTIADGQAETSVPAQIEMPLPAQAIAETEQEHATPDTLKATETSTNDDNNTITTHTDIAPDQDDVSAADKNDDNIMLPIANDTSATDKNDDDTTPPADEESTTSKIENTDIGPSEQKEVLDTSATKSTHETEENNTPNRTLSTLIDDISAEEETLLATLDSNESSDEKQIDANENASQPQAANKADPIAPAEDTLSAVTYTNPTNSNEAMHLDSKVIMTEQSKSTTVDIADEEKQQKHEKIEQKPGFFRWLLAKILGN